MFMHIDHPDSIYYHVYDCLARCEIKGCVWADDNKNMYCRYKRNKRTNEPVLIREDIYGEPQAVTEIRRGKICFIHHKDWVI